MAVSPPCPAIVANDVSCTEYEYTWFVCDACVVVVQESASPGIKPLPQRAPRVTSNSPGTIQVMFIRRHIETCSAFLDTGYAQFT